MNCTRMKPETHWTNVGYNAARRGVTFEAVKVLDKYELANKWIKNGMAKWERRAARLGRDRAAGRVDGVYEGELEQADFERRLEAAEEGGF